MFTYVVEEGQRVLMRRPDGTMDVIDRAAAGLARPSNVFKPMQHFVAHPGEFLIVRFRDGRQEHLRPGRALVRPPHPPGGHLRGGAPGRRQGGRRRLQQKEGTSSVQRRIDMARRCSCPGPASGCTPSPGTHRRAARRASQKVPQGLVFQKLWLMPDQMYHDVPDVRTADDAVLTIRLMIFFELLDIATMLETTHDPIGDFVNAATSDVVDFTGQHDFESFKQQHRQAQRAGDLPPAHRPRGAVRLPDQQGRLPRLRRARAAPADARPGDRGAHPPPARPRHGAAGAGPGELQARQPDAPRRQAAARAAAEVAHELELDAARSRRPSCATARPGHAFERAADSGSTPSSASGIQSRAGPAAARAPGGAARPGRGPDRLPDAGPRRPGHRAPRPEGGDPRPPRPRPRGGWNGGSSGAERQRE